MRRGAQGVGWCGCRRTHQLRDLIYRVCLTEARSAKGVTRYTPRPSTTGCPKAKPQGRSQQGRLLWGTFLGGQEKCLRRRAHNPASAQSAEVPKTNSCYQKQSKDVDRTRGNSSFHPKTKSAHLPKPSPASLSNNAYRPCANTNPNMLSTIARKCGCTRAATSGK